MKCLTDETDEEDYLLRRSNEIVCVSVCQSLEKVFELVDWC